MDTRNILTSQPTLSSWYYLFPCPTFTGTLYRSLKPLPPCWKLHMQLPAKGFDKLKDWRAEWLWTIWGSNYISSVLTLMRTIRHTTLLVHACTECIRSVYMPEGWLDQSIFGILLAITYESQNKLLQELHGLCGSSIGFCNTQIVPGRRATHRTNVARCSLIYIILSRCDSEAYANATTVLRISC